jgi:hypothetical protein
MKPILAIASSVGINSEGLIPFLHRWVPVFAKQR